MIPQEAIDLILEAEGIDQPFRWPGEVSGITIGYGYDLGYEKNFASDWRDVLPSGAIERLKAALGVRGQNARAIASHFRDITIPPAAALKVFRDTTLPHYEAETLAAFPGLDRLPDLVRGALVSLVFNRGADMTGARRAEMRAIRDAVAHASHESAEAGISEDLQEIADQLRAMKHIWAGRGIDGLLKRRDAEADLVEQAINA
jgi:GH24 family phage-related lysozyme (muramidase)